MSREDAALYELEHRLRKIERGYENALKRIFSRWGDRVIARLRAALRGGPVVEKSVPIDLVLGDPDDLFHEVADSGRKAAISATKAGQVSFRVAYGIEPPDFNLLDPHVKNRFERLNTLSKYITDRTIGKLREVIAGGIREGVPEEELGYRIRDAINTTNAQARRIARTEMAKVYNQELQYCAQKSFRQGLLDMKTWVTAADVRVRPAHRVASGQTVPINEPFVVGGERLDHPGDPNGSAANVINCRCTVAYDLDDRVRNPDYDLDAPSVVARQRNRIMAIADPQTALAETLSVAEKAVRLNIREGLKHFDDSRMIERLKTFEKRPDLLLEEDREPYFRLLGALDKAKTPEERFYLLQQLRETEGNVLIRSKIDDMLFDYALEMNETIVRRIRDVEGWESSELARKLLAQNPSPQQIAQLRWIWQYQRALIPEDRSGLRVVLGKNGRAEYLIGFRTMMVYKTYTDKDGKIRPNTTSVVHEYGHHLQEHGTGTWIKELVRHWYAGRTAGKPLKEIPDLPGEHYRDGGFAQPYVGKVYRWPDGDRGVEVISMGLQYLYEYPAFLLFKDPEHFYLSYAVNRGLLMYPGDLEPVPLTRRL